MGVHVRNINMGVHVRNMLNMGVHVRNMLNMGVHVRRRRKRNTLNMGVHVRRRNKKATRRWLSVDRLILTWDINAGTANCADYFLRRFL